MGRIIRQLELMPTRPQTYAERKAEIHRRLDGYAYRQAAREAKRKAADERRRAGREATEDPRQVTIADLLERTD